MGNTPVLPTYAGEVIFTKLPFFCVANDVNDPLAYIVPFNQSITINYDPSLVKGKGEPQKANRICLHGWFVM